MPKIICIDGNIGAGKTTTLMLLREMGFSVHQEELRDWNWVLEKFYRDQARWALTLQVDILNSFMRIYNEISRMKDDFVFVERSLRSYLVFSRTIHRYGGLTNEELRTVENLYALFDTSLIQKTFLINTPVDVCVERINQRNRECEKNIEKSYLEMLDTEYKKMPCIVIDGTKSPENIVKTILERM